MPSSARNTLALLAATASAIITPRQGLDKASLKAQLKGQQGAWLNKLGHDSGDGSSMYKWRDSGKIEDLLKTMSGEECLVKAQNWAGDLGAQIRPLLCHPAARGYGILTYIKNWNRVNTDGDSSLSLAMRSAGEWVVQYEINLLNGDLSASSLHAVARSSGPPRHRRDAFLFPQMYYQVSRTSSVSSRCWCWPGSSSRTPLRLKWAWARGVMSSWGWDLNRKGSCETPLRPTSWVSSSTPRS